MKAILLEIRQTGSTELSDLDLENIDVIQRKLAILSKKIIEVIVLIEKYLRRLLQIIIRYTNYNSL